MQRKRNGGQLAGGQHRKVRCAFLWVCFAWERLERPKLLWKLRVESLSETPSAT
jgi:hypothetical protein